MLTQRGDEKSQVTMSDSPTTDPPTIVINQRDGVTTPTKSGKLTKKHILLAVVSLVIAGLIVVAVLVGIHLVMQGNKETLQLSLTMRNPGGSDSQQNVSFDANANIVVNHITTDGMDITINDDFDKDIQLLKIIHESTVGCFITPLNRSNAFDPKRFPLPKSYNVSGMVVTQTAQIDANSTFSVYMSYDVAPTPVNDTTFLGKRASALCSNIPVYWLHPTCTGTVAESMTTTGNHTRSRRGFNCSCGWKYCYKKILWWTVKYICGFECRCCLNSFCVSANSDCAACLRIGTWERCRNIC